MTDIKLDPTLWRNIVATGCLLRVFDTLPAGRVLTPEDVGKYVFRVRPYKNKEQFFMTHFDFRYVFDEGIVTILQCFDPIIISTQVGGIDVGVEIVNDVYLDAYWETDVSKADTIHTFYNRWKELAKSFNQFDKEPVAIASSSKSTKTSP